MLASFLPLNHLPNLAENLQDSKKRDLGIHEMKQSREIPLEYFHKALIAAPSAWGTAPSVNIWIFQTKHVRDAPVIWSQAAIASRSPCIYFFP